jgi:hypothetical protein
MNGPIVPLDLYRYEQQASIIESTYLFTQGDIRMSRYGSPVSHFATLSTADLGPWSVAPPSQSMGTFTEPLVGGREK